VFFCKHFQAGSKFVQTVMGSAKLLLDTDEHPGKLKDMVAIVTGAGSGIGRASASFSLS